MVRRGVTPKAKPAGPAPAPPPFVPPYPPSWFDRLKHWVERLPGPFWLAYLLFWIGLFTIETIMHWRAGAYPFWTLNALHAVLTLFVPGGLCLMHGLDRLAERSFDSFQPTLLVGSDPAALRYQLTTLPRRIMTLVVTGSILLGGTVSITTPRGGRPGSLSGSLEMMQVAPSPVIVAFNLVVMTATFAVVGLVVYHTIRQLRWVGRIYTRWTSVDLLKPGPLYNLSRLSAGTSLGLVVVVYIILAADRAFMNDSRNVIGAGLAGLLAVLAFVLPLIGVHRALVAEKERLLDESADRMKTSLAELHRRVDVGDLRAMDALNKAIGSLEIERNLLGRIPTWPWQPESLRTVIVALLLPLVLWGAQALLGRMLAP